MPRTDTLSATVVTYCFLSGNRKETDRFIQREIMESQKKKGLNAAQGGCEEGRPVQERGTE